MNPKLIEAARKALAAKPRRHVKIEDVLAVIKKESGFSPIFNPNDLLYKQNLRAAQRITGLPATEIIAAVRIPSGEFKGELAKFRCEPGYWEWAKKFTRPARDEFLLSCSFGLGQKMARWLVANTPEATWMQTVVKFMGDVPTQLLYICGDLDALMIAAGGNKPVAFTRYNEGTRFDPVTKKPVPRITEYGRVTDKYRTEIAKALAAQ